MHFQNVITVVTREKQEDAISQAFHAHIKLHLVSGLLKIQNQFVFVIE